MRLIPLRQTEFDQDTSLVAQMVKNLGWEVFLPGEFHGQRNLVGYSPWGCKELDMTE